MTAGEGLVNAIQSIIPEEKIVNYLLSLAHPVGRHKAVWFLNTGFRPQAWTVLAEALRQQAFSGRVRDEEMTEYGRKVIVDGVIATPASGMVPLTSVWMVGDDDVPRFVTAYPG